MKIESLKDLETIKEKGKESLYPEGKIKIAVGMATCGLATGAQEVFDALANKINGKNSGVILSETACLGYCQKEPIVDVMVPGWPRLIYSEFPPKSADDLVGALLNKDLYKENLLCLLEEEEILIQGETKKYSSSASIPGLKGIMQLKDIPFFSRQKKIVLRNCGYINPESIDIRN